jgi:hypothetical protein
VDDQNVELLMPGHGRGAALARILLICACLAFVACDTGDTSATSGSPISSSPVGSPLQRANAAFAACPDISKALPVGATSNAAAAAVAIKLVLATPEVAVRLSDPVAPANGLIPRVAGSARASVLGSMSARHDGLVVHACGHRVAARSWRVTIDDGTTSASLDSWVYLVRRQSGWKVWGTY